MTLSHTPRVSQKSSSHKSHTAEATVVAPATDAPSSTAASPGAVTDGATAVTSALTKKVIAQLDAIEGSLGLDIVIRPKEKSLIGAGNRVSDKAIGLAADIVSAAPERFPDFTGLPAAASYLQSVGQVASRASELAMHIQNSLSNQRVPAATQTLALYSVVKGLGRIVTNQTMREKVPALKAELAPRRKASKPKETKTAKAVKANAKQVAKRVVKAKNVLVTAGVLPLDGSTAAATNVATEASITPAATTAAVVEAATGSPAAASTTPSTKNGAAQATPLAGH